MNIMAWLFITITAFSVLHFVYEGIIAPSLRLKWRCDLFALRDRLRRLKCEHPDELTDEVFIPMQRSLNRSIALLHRVNVVVLHRASLQYQHSQSLIEQSAKFGTALEACPLDEVREIRQKSLDILLHALQVNHGGAYLYVVPIALGVALGQKLVASIEKAIKLPEKDFEQIMPIK